MEIDGKQCECMTSRTDNPFKRPVTRHHGGGTCCSNWVPMVTFNRKNGGWELEGECDDDQIVTHTNLPDGRAVFIEMGEGLSTEDIVKIVDRIEAEHGFAR